MLGGGGIPPPPPPPLPLSPFPFPLPPCSIITSQMAAPNPKADISLLHQFGRCVIEDTQVDFFPHIDPQEFPTQAAANRALLSAAHPAIEFCRSCSVIEECFDFACQSGIRYGVWGGMIFDIVRVRNRNVRRRQWRKLFKID